MVLFRMKTIDREQLGCVMFLTHFARYQLSPSLQHLIVNVTNHCNFRCKHCFIDFSKKRELDLEKYQEIGREVGPLFWLDIAGGEPFLRKDLIDIISSFQAEVVTIPTNAFMVERTVAMAMRLKEAIKSELTIAISVDGLKETHDRIRKAGSWDRLWTTYGQLRKIKGLHVKINTVLCNENKSEILPLMEYVYQQRPDFHSIILLRGSPMDPSFGLPTMEELHAMQGPIFEILGRYHYGQNFVTSHLLRNYHRYLWNVSLATLSQHTQVIPCLAGQAHAVIMSNGDVSSCEMLPPIGNLNQLGWRQIWEEPTLEVQRRSIRNKECYCTHNCAMLDSILYRPASYPGLITGVTLEQ
ncbi:conserved hypothetical protein [Gammaproteobacteria bacterium]